MVDDAKHPTEALQDVLDHRLDPAKRAEVEAHLADCDRCRRELEVLRWTKDLLRSASGSELPLDFGTRLSTALDDEDRARRAAPDRTRLRALAAFVAAAAAIVAAIWFAGRSPTEAIPRAIAGELRQHGSGTLPLEILSADPAALEAHFAGKLPFPMKVYDLNMMAYPLVGAAVRPVSGRAGALVAYRGPEGLSLLCRMYEGSLAELPEPAARRGNEGIAFHVYRDSEVTLVFWTEGSVVCVLAGDGDPEAVVQLAFAKAVRV